MAPREKFIAYIDIIGFSHLLAEAEAGRGFRQADILPLVQLLGGKKDRESFEKYGPTLCPCSRAITRNLDYQVTQISDCALHSCEVSPAGVINLIGTISTAIMGLLLKGLMCRGYITRGMIDHTETQFLGTGVVRAVEGERNVSLFKRAADKRGTPYVEVDALVTDYVQKEGDACTKELFSRMVKRDGDLVAVFPFQRLAHSFAIGRDFNGAKEKAHNDTVRQILRRFKEQVGKFVDPANPDAVRKSEHYLAALDAQLGVCARTDQIIDTLQRPFGSRRSDAAGA